TSASTDKWQDAFFAEMAGIVAGLNPTELYVLRCDHRVHDADRLESPEELEEFRTKVNDDGIGGGGGTKFEPVFEWIEANDVQPARGVSLTDCLGTYPTEAPDYQVIWADVVGLKTPPFGQVVRVKV